MLEEELIETPDEDVLDERVPPLRGRGSFTLEKKIPKKIKRELKSNGGSSTEFELKKA